ncbi:MAG: ABC transporter permease [Pseudomonadota bacterium]
MLPSALRRLRRAPITTGLNVLALALGFACFICALGVAQYWNMSDSQFANSDRTYVLTQEFGDGVGTSTGPRPRSTPTAAKYMREDFPELEAVARLANKREWTVAAGDRRAALIGARADREITTIFDFDFLAGDGARALDAPDKVVLTQTAAERLFGRSDPMGQTIHFAGDFYPVVSGVIADIQAPSHFVDVPGSLGHFDFIYGWPTDLDEEDWWLGTTGATYVLFPSTEAEISPARLLQRFPDFLERRVPDEQKAAVEFRLGLVKLSDLQARMIDMTLFGGRSSGLLSVTTLLSLLGLLVLVVACVNYANLATAQATSHVKEVGMRKVLGAGRAEIWGQYWFEALLLAIAAAIISLALIWFAAPVIANLTFIDLRAGLFSSLTPLAIIALGVVAVSLLASLYPVVIVSRVRPVEAVRAGSMKGGPKRAILILIGAQFAVASWLLIVLSVINAQNGFLRQANLGGEDVIVFATDDDSQAIGSEILRADLAQSSAIKSVTEIDYLPWSNYDNYLGFSRQADGGGNEVSVFQTRVGHEFFETFDMTLLAGRVFDPDRSDGTADLYRSDDPGDVLQIVIDAPLARSLGFATPGEAIGEAVYFSRSFKDTTGIDVRLEVIGVIAPKPMVFSANENRSNAYILTPEAGAYIIAARIDAGRVDQALGELRSAIAARNPDALPRLQFMDEAFESGFRTFSAVNSAFLILSLLAFAVSLVGLFAMAVFIANRRRHEIGVRKTLGATTGQVTGLLLKEFTVPVLIGNLVAWPLAYSAANAYLGTFLSRIDLTPIPWIASLVITLLVGWIAVGGQAWRAARIKPAEVLRYE